MHDIFQCHEQQYCNIVYMCRDTEFGERCWLAQKSQTKTGIRFRISISTARTMWTFQINFWQLFITRIHFIRISFWCSKIHTNENLYDRGHPLKIAKIPLQQFVSSIYRTFALAWPLFGNHVRRVFIVYSANKTAFRLYGALSLTIDLHAKWKSIREMNRQPSRIHWWSHINTP